jgi:predicted nucleotidyltransferase
MAGERLWLRRLTGVNTTLDKKPLRRGSMDGIMSQKPSLQQKTGGQVTAIRALTERLVAWAQTQPQILALYLYGSYAEGRANAMSDVDVAILAREDLTREQLWNLERKSSAQWPESVDLRVLNLAPLAFRYQVTARGQRLWASDVGRVADWESLTWRLYWDWRPRLERDWQQYVRHVMEQKNEAERQQYQAALDHVRAVHRRAREAAIDLAGDAPE